MTVDNNNEINALCTLTMLTSINLAISKHYSLRNKNDDTFAFAKNALNIKFLNIMKIFIENLKVLH
jgi:hypothetical protein